MTRLAHDQVIAAGGMDNTSDPALLGEMTAQVVQNLLTGWPGVLRGTMRLADLFVVGASLGPITGLGILYAQNPVSADGVIYTTPPAARLMIAQGNSLYSWALTGGLGYPPTWNNMTSGGLYLAGKRVRSVGFDSELYIVQDALASHNFRMGSDGVFLPLGQTVPGGSAFSALTVVAQNPTRSATAWASSHAYPGGSFVLSNGNIYQTANGGTSGSTGPSGTATFQDGTVLWSFVTTNGGGGNKTGVVQYVQTWVDNQGRESSPSLPVLSVDFTGGNAGKDTLITISTGAITDPQCQAVNLYATTGNGSVFYLIATINRDTMSPPSSHFTWEDNAADSFVNTGVQAPHFGQNDAPQPGGIITTHKNRVVMNDNGAPNVIQISNAGSATQFNSIGVLVDANGNISNPNDGITLEVGTDQGDIITGLVSFGSLLVIFRRRSIYLLYGSDLTDFELRKLHNKGCIAPDSIAGSDNMVCFLSDDGVYALTGGFDLVKLSQPLDSKMFAYNTPANRSAVESSLGWIVDNRYHWCPAIAGEGIWVYDFLEKQWSNINLLAVNQNFGAVCVIELPGLPAQAYLGYANGAGVTILDFYSPALSVPTVVYRTRPIRTDYLPWHLRMGLGEQQVRSIRKRLRRIKVYGSSNSLTGSVTFTVDGKSETYSTLVGTDPVQGILLTQEATPNMSGRAIDVTLTLQGQNLVLRDIECDFDLVG